MYIWYAAFRQALCFVLLQSAELPSWKEGEQPVINDDDAAAEGGQTEVQPAVGNNDSDEGCVVEALLQIRTKL